ncbi:MAG: putative superfamily hydrolase [Anaerocolumna sp.]|jgi:putative hydrolase of HD superfamily|nr:putative superfamily hydrolase [Anaerocolumna sp.]
MDGDLKIELRELQVNDLDAYLYFNHPDREYHKYDGPYYHHKNEEELRIFVDELKQKFMQGEDQVLPNKKLIIDGRTKVILGQVNWYWKSVETLWLEVGIILYDEGIWGHGVGKTALKLWINEVFLIHPQIVRVGLSTWSGNLRMIRLAKRLGMTREACYRKARIVNGAYYDSISYGVLREEWEFNI